MKGSGSYMKFSPNKTNYINRLIVAGKMMQQCQDPLNIMLKMLTWTNNGDNSITTTAL